MGVKGHWTVIGGCGPYNLGGSTTQTCHMLPLDHFNHTRNSGTIQASNSFGFSRMSLFQCEICLDALIMSIARMYAMPINFYLGLLEGEACHMSGGASTHI